MGKVQFILDAEMAQAVQGILKVVDAQKKSETGHKGITDSIKGQEKATTKLGRDTVQQFVNMTTGALSFGGALATIKKALADINEERKRAAALAKTTTQSVQMLAQVATSKADYQHLLKQTRSSVFEGMTVQEAADLQFALRSEGQEKFRDVYARLSSHGLIRDEVGMVSGVGTIQSAFGKRAGNVRQVLAKLLAGAAESRVTAEQFAPAASIAAQTVKQIGGSDVGLLAALTHLSKATKSPEVASTQIQAFAKVMAKKGMTGSLSDLVTQVGEMGMTNEETWKYFGEAEAVKGYLGMQDLAPAILATKRRLRLEARRAGTEEGYLSQRLAMVAEQHPEYLRNLRKRAAEEWTTAEYLGEQGLEQETVERGVRIASMKAGESDLDRWAREKTVKALHLVGVPPEYTEAVNTEDFIRQQHGNFKPRTGPENPEAQDAIQDFHRAADKLDRALAPAPNPNAQVE